MRTSWNKKKALTSLELIWKPMYRLLYPITKLLYTHTSIVPNNISCLNFFIGLIAIFFMGISGHFSGLFGLSEYTLRLLGAILAFCYICLDSMDGQLARGGNLSSESGSWLDSTMDSIMVPFFMLSLAIGMNNYFALLAGGIAALCFPIQLLIQYQFKLKFQDKLKKSLLGTKSPVKYIYGTAIFFCFNLFFAIINKPLYTLLFFAIFGSLFWIGIIFLQYKCFKKKDIK